MFALLLIAQLAVADTTDVPCTVPVPVGTGAWKQITDADVTFCVPENWRVRGTRASYSGGSIRWQHATPPQARTSGGGPTSISAGRNTASSGVRNETFSEMIGGVQGTLAWQSGVGRLTSSVTFRQPLFSIAGEAAGDEQVQTQLAVYRTVRFTR